MKGLVRNTALLFILSLAACNSVETKTRLDTPVTGQLRTAGPGDTVLSFQSRRSLPNAFGRADLFGRTTNAGGTTVRYIGTSGGQAIFERTDVQITSNATTMSETPLILPQTTNTALYGSVGNVPVSGNATSTSYQFIPARGSSQYASMQRPIQFGLGSGQQVTVEGRKLTVVAVGASSVNYKVE